MPNLFKDNFNIILPPPTDLLLRDDFTVYSTTLSVSQVSWRRMVDRLVNKELARTLKEAVVA
jgi:hypothetical protein